MPDARRPLAVVACPVSPRVVDLLRRDREIRHVPDARSLDDVGDVLSEVELFVLRSTLHLGASEIAAMPRLRTVVRAGSGVDNLDLDALADAGIELVRPGGAPSARSVAELALQSTLALLRNVPRASAALAAGVWDKHGATGRELGECRIAVWGAGPVGRAVADVVGALGGDVVFARHRSVPTGAAALSPPDLYAGCDVHVLALPLRDTTRGLIGPESLAAMRPRRPHLVNVGRWDLIDVPAAMQALVDGGLAGLAVDPVDPVHAPVVAARLAEYPGLNVQFTPHLGAMTTGAADRMADELTLVLGRHSPDEHPT